MGYDVFIRYNSQDHSAVGEIARKLYNCGVRTFLYRRYFVPGRPRQQRLSTRSNQNGKV
jgi:hypothetical protein